MMNNTSKYTITQEPAIYEGIEYSKIASRLGFNPTTINKMINKQIKNAA